MTTGRKLHEHYVKQEEWGWGRHNPFNRMVIRDCEVDLAPHPVYGSDIEDIYKSVEKAKQLGCNYFYQKVENSSPDYPNHAKVTAVRYRIESDEEYHNRLKEIAETSLSESQRLREQVYQNISLNKPFELY